MAGHRMGEHERTARAKLILASASPRRREILKGAGIPFTAITTSIPEIRRRGESPRVFVQRLAWEKAAAAQYALASRSAATHLLGADTVVVVGNEVLGKPASSDDARRMLRLLSGRQHRVLTGVCLLSINEYRTSKDVRVESTVVKFSRMSTEEIQAYIETKEPFDKAGAYGIQGAASKHIEWVRGCYFNVVGLPISLVYRMLKRADFSL
jgi:septum formation protein